MRVDDNQVLKLAIAVIFDYRLNQIYEAKASIDPETFNVARGVIEAYFEDHGNEQALKDWRCNGIVCDLQTLKKHGLLDEQQLKELSEPAFEDYSLLRELVHAGNLPPFLQELVGRVDALKLGGLRSEEYRALKKEIDAQLGKEKTLNELREHYANSRGDEFLIVKRYLRTGEGQAPLP